MSARFAPCLLIVLSLSCHRAPHPTTPLASTTELQSQLEAVARREVSLFTLADPARGFAYALRRDDASGEDARADADDYIAITERVCSAEATPIAPLTTMLELHSDPSVGTPVTCTDLVCVAPHLGEYSTTIRFIFARAPDGRLVLDTVLEVEEAAIIEAVAAERWSDAERAVTELPSSCP